jgi:hypothetical protein
MPETSVIVGVSLAVHFFVGLGLRAASALSLALIQPSAWKWNSANFAYEEA